MGKELPPNDETKALFERICRECLTLAEGEKKILPRGQLDPASEAKAVAMAVQAGFHVALRTSGSIVCLPSPQRFRG